MSDDSRPLVSVVLPTYDRPQKLRAAVESVAAQTYSNIELLVVDDCSPTPARPVLATDAPESLNYTCIRHEENRGANAARNTGIRAAEGEIVAFLDDDDRWDPTKTMIEVETFAGDPDVGVVLHGQRTLHEGRLTDVRTPEVSGDATVGLLQGKRGATFSSIAVRRSIIDDAGLPDETLPSWQDREWLLRLSKHCRFAVQPDSLVIRRSGTYHQIGDEYEKKRDVSFPRILEKHRELAAKLGYEGQFIASMTNVLAGTALQNGFKQDARRYALKSIRHDPMSLQPYLYFLLAVGNERLLDSVVRCRRATKRPTHRLRQLVR
jgi:glycosyltransferase involved in cell wall biosynthesis